MYIFQFTKIKTRPPLPHYPKKVILEAQDNFYITSTKILPYYFSSQSYHVNFNKFERQYITNISQQIKFNSALTAIKRFASVELLNRLKPAKL